MINSETVLSIQRTPAFHAGARTVSDGSIPPATSSEQLALVGFAHRLYSVASNNDLGSTDEQDVREEARLLMSLACSSPTNISIESGRVTPPSDASSCHSTGSRNRNTFTFLCPSLSLENPSQSVEARESISTVNSKDDTETGPAALLGRVLKLDDRDALRLSSEAMARNIMQSYEKAMKWRIKSWAGSLSRVLVDMEKELKARGMATEENIKKLCESSEAMLIVRLREIAEKVHVVDACTNFKVLPQKATKAGEEDTEDVRKRQQRDDTADAGLGESEYEYTVAHLLTLECDLNIQAPGVGHVSIDLKVPGTMSGTFLSLEDGYEELSEVLIDVDTKILASMIEKSSRLVIRSTVEALLKTDSEKLCCSSELEKKNSQESSPRQSSVPLKTARSAPKVSIASVTPKRKISEERIAGVVITPRDSASSPSPLGDSNNDDKPILTIPDNFSRDQPKASLAPQRKRPQNSEALPSLPTSLPPMKKRKALPQLVTPSKTTHEFAKGNGPVPNLPALVEVALSTSK